MKPENAKGLLTQSDVDGGLIGGAARAAALSPAKRKQIAAKAARARWGKPK